MANILKRFSHRIMVISAAALLTVGTYAVAQEFRGDHPDTYVVKRGDTLWDIAGRFLKRPWLWPEIWQANPQIANPHLIYPGDVISLAYLDRVGSVGIQPGPRTDSPINAISLSDIEAYLRDLRVVDSFKELPYVVSLEEDIARGVQGQLAYVRGLEGAQVGQRYAVVRATQRYARIGKRECCDMMSRNDIDRRGNRIPGFGTSWSDTAGNETGGEELGNELMKVNVGTVTKLMEGDVEATSLRLDEPNQEVRIGDRLIPVDAQPYDLQFFPHPPKQPLDNDKARVLAVANGMTTGGPRDVIAMSVGAQDGIDNGTVLSIWRQGTNAVDRIEVGQWRGDESVTKDARVQLPDEYAGHVMIFRTFDKVSYGLVMQSTKPSRVGYRLKHPDAM